MTLGRIATFLVILAISVAVADRLVRRHAVSARPPASVAAPPSAPAPGSAIEEPRSPEKSAGPPVASVPEKRSSPGVVVTEDPLSEAVCRPGMLLVDGTTCAVSHRRCAEFDPRSSGDVPRDCLRYEPAACRKGLPVRVCIDRYEYPNVEGMRPAILVPFAQARAACADEGKRLCTETEWAFACEGPRGFAFPYGDGREEGACNAGKAAERVRPEALWEARDIAGVVARIDARAPSGAQPGCTSAFGVRDMTGNVEEWVASDVPGFRSALRGGAYTDRPTCATTRQIRQTGFRQVHTGFRCCADPVARAAPPDAPAP